MNKQTYKEVIEELTKERKDVSDRKRKDYTVENEDQFYNFKFIAGLVGIDPLEVWAVYKLKHTLAIMNYIQNKHESEPIRERFVDELNYGELGFGLVLEQEEPEHFKKQNKEKKEVPEFFDTPNACYHGGCMCERTDKFVEENNPVLTIIDWIEEWSGGYIVHFYEEDVEPLVVEQEHVKTLKVDGHSIASIELEDGNIYKDNDLSDNGRTFEKLQSTGRSFGI